VKREGIHENDHRASCKETKWYVSCSFSSRLGRTGDTGRMPRQNADVLATLDLTKLYLNNSELPMFQVGLERGACVWA